MTTKSMLRAQLTILALVVLGTTLGSTANAYNQTRRAHRFHTRATNAQYGSAIPSGTSLQVILNANISTDDTHVGDAWSGTTGQALATNNHVNIPAGSPVSGIVTVSVQGTHNVRPQLALAVRSVVANGQTYPLNADMPTVVGGSQNAKKLGAVAGGAALGALLGHTVAKDEHGTLIGGVVGGAAGYGLSRNAMRSLQFKQGTPLPFTTRNEMAYRR